MESVWEKRRASACEVSGITITMRVSVSARTIAGLSPDCSCPNAGARFAKQISPFYILKSLVQRNENLAHLLGPTQPIPHETKGVPHIFESCLPHAKPVGRAVPLSSSWESPFSCDKYITTRPTQQPRRRNYRCSCDKKRKFVPSNIAPLKGGVRSASRFAFMRSGAGSVSKDS